MSTTNCTSSTCCASASSRTTAVYCSTCSPPSESAESPAPADSLDETASARSLSSDSTVTGVPVERPLLRPKAPATQRTPQSTGRRSLASSTSTVLQASTRTDTFGPSDRSTGGKSRRFRPFRPPIHRSPLPF
ncbi:hypothetical protein M3Y99_01914000 [Aphelenchoides fujianensis]|nr:hypothetical protein M3Y99_01914000 [Aphelenchoides fujianensis]